MIRDIVRSSGISLLLFFGQATLAFAEGAAPVGTPPAAPSPLQTFFPIILMFGVVYFLMIRPQQKRMKEQQDLVNNLKDGDEIVTNSGILGTIRGQTEKVVTVEIADKVRVKMLKSQVSQVVKGNIQELK